MGEAVQQHWQDLPKRFSNISLGAYISMPNHLHGIITIHPVGALLAAPILAVLMLAALISGELRIPEAQAQLEAVLG